MKKITVKLYTFDELDNAAKEKVLSDYRYDYTGDIDTYEIDELEEFLEIDRCFHYQSVFYRWRDYERFGDISGVRALTYIYNNFIAPYAKRDFRCHIGGNEEKNYSNIHVYYAIDDGIMAAYREMRDDVRKGKKNVDMDTFLDYIADYVNNWVEGEEEYLSSDEYISDRLTDEGLLFFEDGTEFNAHDTLCG